jgi:anthranilate phosphoribosyltransferase
VADGAVTETTLDPGVLGIAPVPPEALRGGDRTHNAAVVREVVGGEGGAVRDAVLLNAAAGIAAYDGPTRADLADVMRAALDTARESIDSGAAARVLDRWIEFSSTAR